ncbi:NAD-dependent epimerase/dehydratase family protein [Rathayibacter soli]|uniref:NAD-dependent epimerase/dehydratase family protein n=1 Tax=Rathayibacter soli TaxID=3144168 RepID=UPI0027E3D9ED|nr:NAD-dependent epimerase/dehydratase family protein [Glaciibacter superstes]
MRVVVIGATGHVGSYLIPRLVDRGDEVVALSRGIREPYRSDPRWQRARRIAIDRDALDAAGTFGALVAELKPDVVIDLICFTAASAQQLVEALRGTAALLITCGSIWIHGPLTEVPGTEDAPRNTWGAYGLGKAAIEDMLLAESRSAGGLPCIVLHPGHISGPGWRVINPAANLNLDVWARLASGREVVLPNLGLETLHHVHADDVAQAFERAIDHAADAAGSAFSIVSPRALTLRGYAQAVAGWSGREASLRFVPFEEFRAVVGDQNADITWDHIARSPAFSIEKAQRMLGYAPRYTSLEAVAEAVRWLHDDGQLN